MDLIELKKRPSLSENEKLNSTYSRFEMLLKELKKKELPKNIIKSINQHTEELNATSFTDKKLRRLIEKKHGEIQTFVAKELKITPKGHYLSIGIAIGVSIGMMLGTVFGLSLDNIGLMAIGIPVGVAIGLAIGAKMDKTAFEEGRQLNFRN